ncbi:MAG TPA: hypothetical protein VLE53_05060 [Gemmatimonadaceae bacterium]|nr:hypothetical protein [Gemmatimonadaceae bacterium]
MAVIPVELGATGSTMRAGRFTYVTSSRIDMIEGWDGAVVPTLVTRVTIRNDAASAVEITHGACNVSVDAYRSPDRRGAPVWNHDRSESWDRGDARACDAVLLMTHLAPGEVKQLGVNFISLIDILGDSLPDGWYFLTARTRSSSTPAGIQLPAGDFDLTVARPALRDSVRHGGLTYRAWSTVPSGGGVVQATVTAVSHAGGILIGFPRACAVTLAAYVNRERRDAAPRSGAPDWQQVRACAEGEQVYSLGGGKGLTFQETVQITDILGASRPDGEYHLAVMVRTPTRNLWLSAGSVALRR